MAPPLMPFNSYWLYVGFSEWFMYVALLVENCIFCSTNPVTPKFKYEYRSCAAGRLQTSHLQTACPIVYYEV
jgi:hypothetical protein